MDTDFVETERARTVAWKERTGTLPDAARAPAPYIRDGKPVGKYEYCLRAPYAIYNLLPEIRESAVQF